MYTFRVSSEVFSPSCVSVKVTAVCGLSAPAQHERPSFIHEGSNADNNVQEEMPQLTAAWTKIISENVSGEEKKVKPY